MKYSLSVRAGFLSMYFFHSRLLMDECGSSNVALGKEGDVGV